VLTHTHAGVGALRGRLSQLGVPAERFRVETIASWALRMSANYPSLSGLGTTRPTGAEWNATYPAAERLLQTRVGRTVVQGSYDTLFVDEYQDCIESQHRLVLALANLMPCRVVGDPLQGIFGFRGNRLVSWETDVFPQFDRVPDLNHPWRWDRHPELGRWLLSIRPALERGLPIDTSGSPVAWRQQGEERSACFDVARRDGSAVALRQWARDCHVLASQLRGTFTSMEEMDCKELLTITRAFQEASGSGLVRAVIDAAATCMTKVSVALRPILNALDAGRLVASVRPARLSQVVSELSAVEAGLDVGAISRGLRAIARIPGIVAYRRELLAELHRTLAAFGDGGFASLEEAAWVVRNRTRVAGRAAERRVVSRTLLVKGLEFEHVVLCAADELDAKNLYVALTRGSRSVTVVARSPVLHASR